MGQQFYVSAVGGGGGTRAASILALQRFLKESFRPHGVQEVLREKRRVSLVLSVRGITSKRKIFMNGHKLRFCFTPSSTSSSQMIARLLCLGGGVNGASTSPLPPLLILLELSSRFVANIFFDENNNMVG